MQPRPPRNDERSLGELFAELARETGTLVRQEVTLAKTEVTQKASRLGRDIGVLAVGALVAYAGFLALLAAAILGLTEAGLDGWLAALIVGIVVGVVGALLVRQALAAIKREDLAPRQTVETLKEDAQWAKEQVK
ncbi:MAG TPA: phage holin family protein [Chloroflexota bacterium]|jgi:tetrahydromethanopterin S-methyltransferase subunit G|nr:phage holin family protein [Chloroflexota bacterium]HEX2184356.1 phage holin family protein [Chloroflexota bacterium]